MLHEQRRYGQVPVPLPVGWDHVPGRNIAVAATECILVRVQVLRPQRGVVQIAGVVLPVLGRIVETRELALAPGVERDVQEALDDRRAVGRKLTLEAVDS